MGTNLLTRCVIDSKRGPGGRSAAEVCELSRDRLLSGRPERFVDIVVNAFDHLTRTHCTGVDSLAHLVEPFGAMSQIPVEHLARRVDHRPVSGQQPTYATLVYCTPHQT